MNILASRRVFALLVPVALSAGVARAQVDDPGLAPPPPPVRITPPPAPAVIRPSPGPLPPPVNPAREVPFKEEVKEEVSTQPGAALSDDEWEANLAAPSLHGSIGLLRLHAADVGRPLRFRVGVHMQGFTQSNFLIAGSGTTSGDENSRFLGDLTVGLTGPDVTVLRNLELYLAVLNSSNQNKRDDRARTDPQVILSLADVAVGLKGAFEITRGLSLGGHVGLRFFNSISSVSANFDATSVSADLLGTFDVRKYAASVPLRFHLNVGYLVDNSLSLLPSGQCANSQGIDACIRSRVVETFGYGLGVSRLRLAIGVEAPLRPRVPWGIFGVAPFVEYHFENAIGDGDTTVASALTKANLDPNRIDAATIQYLTVGLRLRPAAGLIIDAGVDLGLQSPGFRYGPPLPAWNVIVGASYAFDTGASSTKVITRTVTRTYEAAREPEGRIRGVVRDAKTKQVLAGAIIRYPGTANTAQATGADGSFLSYGMPEGPVRYEVSHGDDHQPTTGAVDVGRRGETAVEILLAPRPPREGRVHIRAVDDKGAPIVGGVTRAVGPAATREGVNEPDGWVISLPPGEYAVSVDAPNYLAREKQVTVASGQDQTIELPLRKRPLKTRVSVTKEAIVLAAQVHFGTNNAVILPDGQQLLDEVVDVMAKNPQIRKVSIEGHTDNRGLADKNLKLSRDRAEAVRAYLVKQGVADDRLSAQGFGATKPLVPNMTAANRAKNRRVEFKILDQGVTP